MARAEVLNGAAFAGLVLVWGSTFLAIRVSNDAGFEPFSAVAWRLLLAAGLLGLIAVARGLPWPRGRELRATMLAGLLMFALNFGLLYYGQLTVPSATAAVLWGVFPMLVTLGAAAALQGAEPLTLRGVAGAAGAALGLAVVFWSHLGAGGEPLGFAAILVGITGAAAANLVTKRWAHQVHPVTYNAVGASVGAAVLVPVAFVLGAGLAPPPNDAAVAALAYLVLAGSMGAFTLWMWLLKRWPAARLSYQTVLSPLIAVVLGALLLAEAVPPTFLAGTALVLAGTFLAVRHRRTPSSTATSPPLSTVRTGLRPRR